MPLLRTKLFYSGALLLALLAALNGAVLYATRNSVPRRVMARIDVSRGASVLALGNSLVDAAFDKPVFERAMRLRAGDSLNLSLGASTPVEQLLLLRYALSQGVHPQVVIYGYYDLQLSTPITITSSDLIGNRAMLYYVEPRYGQSFYEMSRRDRIQFDVARHVPTFSDRGAFWAKVEHFRRTLTQQGMPQESANRFGRAEDFSLLEISETSKFESLCDIATGAELIPPVREIMRQALASGAKVVFVEMPMRPEHVRTYYKSAAWLRYREHVQAVLAESRIDYINASEWIGQDTSFADHLHLTSEGARQFSQRLGETLPAVGMPAPPASLK